MYNIQNQKEKLWAEARLEMHPEIFPQFKNHNDKTSNSMVLIS